MKSTSKRRHAGLGSLGAARYDVLIEGATTSQRDDRILEMKAQAALRAIAMDYAAQVGLDSQSFVAHF